MNPNAIDIAIETADNTKIGGVKNAGEINTGTGSTRERNVERVRQMRSEASGQVARRGENGSLDRGDAEGLRIIPDESRKLLENLGVTNN